MMPVDHELELTVILNLVKGNTHGLASVQGVLELYLVAVPGPLGVSPVDEVQDAMAKGRLAIRRAARSNSYSNITCLNVRQ